MILIFTAVKINATFSIPVFTAYSLSTYMLYRSACVAINIAK